MGFLKSKVYVNRPDNVEDLKERIRREVRLISPAYRKCTKEMYSLRWTLARCEWRTFLTISVN